MLISKNLKKSNFLRKINDYHLKIVKFLKLPFTDSIHYEYYPPIFVNSFPKSGTHLLYQIMHFVPYVRSFGEFIVSTPAIPHKITSSYKILENISRIYPGEIVRGHLFYTDIYEKKLKSKNSINFFIYRDPRDVVISEAYYLTYMLKWHSLHKYFRELNSKEDRISFAINGDKDNKLPYFYPDIATRFSKYKGWVLSNDCFSVKYEDLISNRKMETISHLVEHFIENFEPVRNKDKLIQRALMKINPKESHTYRKGKSNWKQLFNERLIEEMKQIGGNLLIELGYEKNLDW